MSLSTLFWVTNIGWACICFAINVWWAWYSAREINRMVSKCNQAIEDSQESTKELIDKVYDTVMKRR